MSALKPAWPRPPRGALATVLAGAALGLAGCTSITGFTGAAAGIPTGTVSGNPAVGVGVGLAVQAATDEVLKYVFRNLQQTEQDQIAGLAGRMQVGEMRDWNVHHRLPYGNEHGKLQVLGLIDTPLTMCKQVALSVDEGKGKGNDSKARCGWYTAHVCRQDQGWKWATAEPATERWDTLQ